ncbi:MAG: response regulator [Pseudolabrys sp.]|nr:response regulator [Pseudolabrys sp.]
MSIATAPSLAPALKTVSAPRMTILVIDDSEDSRDLTEAALTTGGYDGVQVAASAAEAFKFLDIGGDTTGRPVPVDIILLDIVMPEIDGIEACARIRNDGRYNDVPIIMVTSLADMDSLSNAFVAGANDYITKPVNRIELMARVRAALKLKTELERRLERERELLTFVSSWGDRRATLWVDETSGLFVGEVAEAYLTAGSEADTDELVSVITVAIDRLEAVRATQGEKATRDLQSRVARAVRSVTAAIGVVAASYRNGLLVIVAPDFDAIAAERLAQTIRAAIAKLNIASSETVATDHITASTAVMSGRVQRGPARVRLLTQAINLVQRTAAEGGDRLVAMSA